MKIPFTFRAGQSQRDCVPKPRVARHELPWVSRTKNHQPQRGCVGLESSGGRNPVGVESWLSRFPRVAAQPCGSGRNPFRILMGVLRPRPLAPRDSVSVFSAKGAASYQPGATPQGSVKREILGLKARPIIPTDCVPPAINRAFSARDSKQHASWGVAPGWYKAAPLALGSGA